MFPVFGTAAQQKKIINAQIKMMLKTFNVECDWLMGKASPSNYPRTLERIEKLANQVEQSDYLLGCYFNIEYVELKFKECQLQYQNKLKKQDEREEQRAIREQMREEQKAIKEYERAIKAAEEEEKLYRDLLTKAKQELGEASEADKLVAQQRITELEQQLLEAETKEARAKSMAEQTRKGHVYIISNIGSFGKKHLQNRINPKTRTLRSCKRAW